MSFSPNTNNFIFLDFACFSKFINAYTNTPVMAPLMGAFLLKLLLWLC